MTYLRIELTDERYNMDCITYSNFEEFKEAHPVLADELLKEVSEGAWQNEELYWYKTLGDFAQFELDEGVYCSCSLSGVNLRNMPNPLDFIDLTALGDELSEYWDESSYHRLSDDSVITTSYGW